MLGAVVAVPLVTVGAIRMATGDLRFGGFEDTQSAENRASAASGRMLPPATRLDCSLDVDHEFRRLPALVEFRSGAKDSSGPGILVSQDGLEVVSVDNNEQPQIDVLPGDEQEYRVRGHEGLLARVKVVGSTVVVACGPHAVSGSARVAPSPDTTH